MTNIKDITTGKPWACKFKITKMLDQNGKPVKSGKLGVVYSGPGNYEGVGLIKFRDLKNSLVQLIDVETNIEFVVPFSDIWDVDTVEFID